MKIKTEIVAFSELVNTKSGEQGLIHTASGRQLWMSVADYAKRKEAQDCISFKVHEAGDTFVATKDSKTLVDGKPVFLKGETVTRQKESIEVLGFTGMNKVSQYEAMLAINPNLNITSL